MFQNTSFLMLICYVQIRTFLLFDNLEIFFVMFVPHFLELLVLHILKMKLHLAKIVIMQFHSTLTLQVKMLQHH